MKNLKEVKKELVRQYDEMLSNKMPLFEIASDNIEDEYYLYNIKIDDIGLYTIAYTEEENKKENNKLTVLKIYFDEYIDDLDYYLEGLFELCLDDILTYENNI